MTPRLTSVPSVSDLFCLVGAWAHRELTRGLEGAGLKGRPPYGGLKVRPAPSQRVFCLI